MSMNSRFAVAVHVLTLMAWSDDESLKSDQIAVSVNTNPVVIRRMLCELAGDDLVVSHTGSAGGSRLARNPQQISLLDVYRAVESADAFSLHPKRPNRGCPVGSSIEPVLKEVRTEIDSAIGQVLSGISIGDVVMRLKPNGHRPRSARTSQLQSSKPLRAGSRME
jgi:Rrf2 family protein